MTTYLTTKNLSRFMWISIIVLAFLAGYYQILFENEVKRYKRLEDKYVRVRQELGIEETQRLLDQSYQ